MKPYDKDFFSKHMPKEFPPKETLLLSSVEEAMEATKVEKVRARKLISKSVDLPELKTPLWVAEYLGVSIETVWEWIREKKLFAYTQAKCYRVPVWAIDEFLNTSRKSLHA